MKRRLDFWIFGGDLRQHWLARQLAHDGHQVKTYGLDPTFLREDRVLPQENLDFCLRKPCHCAILPLPVQNPQGQLSAPFHHSPISLGDLFHAMPQGQFVVGGQLKPQVYALAKDRNQTIQDYFAREELTIANAVPTAEGCIQIALERLPCTLQDARILILGYGRVGKATAKRMGALGARITVAARRYDQLAQAKSDGFHTDHIAQLVGGLAGYDAIINTVPAQVLGKAELQDMDDHSLIIDLASLPGGVDLPAAQTRLRTVIPALSLPGKVAPATAGKAIKDCLYYMLDEQEARFQDETAPH